MTPSPSTLVVAPAQPAREIPENPAAEAWKTFREESAGHQLTVLHDDGLYRHLRMAAPGTRMWSWDIVTWPGHLATSGDIADGYTFSRELDMIDFFHLASHKEGYYSDGAPSINFRYWAEKLQGEQRQTVKEHRHEHFLQLVKETLEEDLENGRLTQEGVDELTAEASNVEETGHAAHEWLYQHGDIFPDSWENDFTEYTFNFQLACYAIAAAVRVYLQTKASDEPVAEASGR
ncbi:hypothetical protein [Arthrobacter koreensis]|uniref:hypothetical protein n=1 Tax=Arthrobacter koreensis TaxID=199136 RepID=UPI0038066424